MSCRIFRITVCSIVLTSLLAVAAAPRRSSATDEVAVRQVGRIRTELLDEVSGIVASRRQTDVLWAHDDGDASYVYAIRPSGELVARVRFPAEVRDTEDIAIGPGPREGQDYLYLGDTGDNDENRPEIRIIRFPEPTLESSRSAELAVPEVEELRLTYPDGPHNAEALMIDPLTGDLLIATKEKKRARLYVARAGSLDRGSVTVLERLTAVKCANITGGDISQDGSLIVLRRENRGWLWSRQAGQSVAEALSRKPRGILVRAAVQGANGESIALCGNGRGYYTISEGAHEPICLFSLDRVLAESGGAR